MEKKRKRGPVSYSTYQEAKDRIAALEAVMKELADDVEAYAGVEFSGRDIWPTYQRKWVLAMDVVNRARALLGGGE